MPEENTFQPQVIRRQSLPEKTFMRIVLLSIPFVLLLAILFLNYFRVIDLSDISPALSFLPQKPIPGKVGMLLRTPLAISEAKTEGDLFIYAAKGIIKKIDKQPSESSIVYILEIEDLKKTTTETFTVPQSKLSVEQEIGGTENIQAGDNIFMAVFANKESPEELEIGSAQISRPN